LPAAKPEALTTRGLPKSLAQAFASSGFAKLLPSAVGMPCLTIKAFAKALELSICAAPADGPKQAIPHSVSRSTRPAARGASGPITTRSAGMFCAREQSPSISCRPIFAISPTSAMPALPGEITSLSHSAEAAIAIASACSLAPEPTSSTFIMPPYLHTRSILFESPRLLVLGNSHRNKLYTAHLRQ